MDGTTDHGWIYYFSPPARCFYHQHWPFILLQIFLLLHKYCPSSSAVTFTLNSYLLISSPPLLSLHLPLLLTPLLTPHFFLFSPGFSLFSPPALLALCLSPSLSASLALFSSHLRSVQ